MKFLDLKTRILAKAKLAGVQTYVRTIDAIDAGAVDAFKFAGRTITDEWIELAAPVAMLAAAIVQEHGVTFTRYRVCILWPDGRIEKTGYTARNDEPGWVDALAEDVGHLVNKLAALRKNETQIQPDGDWDVLLIKLLAFASRGPSAAETVGHHLAAQATKGDEDARRSLRLVLDRYTEMFGTRRSAQSALGLSDRDVYRAGLPTAFQMEGTTI